MDEIDLFNFKNYKLYLKHLEAERPGKGRGFRAELARAINCQTAYISQILNADANLSLEQADKLNSYLSHNKWESRFFIHLVELSRAGTNSLKKHFSDLINENIQQNQNLKNRFQIKHTLSEEDQNLYYSNWLYAAVHMAVTIPELQSVDSLAEYFKVPKSTITKVLFFLTSVKLVTKAENDKFNIGTARMHLGQDSGNISKHHSNWRLRAID